MLAVSDHLQNGPAPKPALRSPNRRLWIVDPNCADVPAGSPEPVPSFANKSSDPQRSMAIGTPDLKGVRHYRYRAAIPGERANVYRYLCDVYVFEPADQQRPRDPQIIVRH